MEHTQIYIRSSLNYTYKFFKRKSDHSLLMEWSGFIIHHFSIASFFSYQVFSLISIKCFNLASVEDSSTGV